ncbi:hypothetical protein NXX22_26520 [Bacteroides thetaiotaomicron]|uniref:hypothetical protein n=1 Tax=Bacteroides thetaiotaomicron TaxID=818 RepID=UPI0021659EBA|nr:hypothetical protein [Bacteroides thetaiotaomicron]MCS2785897.1 hypothetical protein [Bacteroides thetaiotaomicron]
MLIQKRTEGECEKTTIHQFVLHNEGETDERNRVPVQTYRTYGNSLTCGYGVEGKDRSEPHKAETRIATYLMPLLSPAISMPIIRLLHIPDVGEVRNYGDSVRISVVTMMLVLHAEYI